MEKTIISLTKVNGSMQMFRLRVEQPWVDNGRVLYDCNKLTVTDLANIVVCMITMFQTEAPWYGAVAAGDGVACADFAQLPLDIANEFFDGDNHWKFRKMGWNTFFLEPVQKFIDWIDPERTISVAYKKLISDGDSIGYARPYPQDVPDFVAVGIKGSSDIVLLTLNDLIIFLNGAAGLLRYELYDYNAWWGIEKLQYRVFEYENEDGGDSDYIGLRLAFGSNPQIILTERLTYYNHCVRSKVESLPYYFVDDVKMWEILSNVINKMTGA